MPIRHQLRDSDTVEFLAHQYLGSADRWREIVEYNDLIYPYLSKNREDKYNVYARGFIKVTRTNTKLPLTIYKHWTVKTRKSLMSSAIKTYSIIENVYMAAGQDTAYAFIRSLSPGIQGNAGEGIVTELGEDFERNAVIVDIINEQPVTGGMEGKILATGDFLFIPNEEDTMYLKDFDTKFSFEEVRFYYGEDLKLEGDDLVHTTAGDLATVNYLANVEQAVNRRFSTEIGDILTDFTFGHRIADIIGDSKLPLEARERLVRLEIINCLLYEDRVSDPVIDSIRIVPEERACYVDVTMTVTKVGDTIELQNVRIGGNE